MNRILIVEDDAAVVRSITGFLSSEGWSVDSAKGQAEALVKLDGGSYDMAILDIALADGNGFSVCAYIKSKSDMPVIFLTASDDEYSVVAGLDMGADDYISKPVRPRELVSRIRSVLRRVGKNQSVIEFGELIIDTEKAIVKKRGEEIFLSALEYRLLLIFALNKGKTFTRNQLLNYIWDAAGDYVNDNTLTVYIKRLRGKIEDDPAEPVYIKTVRGIGYRVGDSDEA